MRILYLDIKNCKGIALICRKKTCDKCFLRFKCLTQMFIKSENNIRMILADEVIWVSSEDAIKYFEYHEKLDAFVWKDSSVKKRSGLLRRCLN